MHLNLYLIPLFLILMVGDVVGRIKKNEKMVSICQPGTTIVVLIMAMMSLMIKGHHTGYTLAISAGLLLSAIADGMLVDRSDPKGFIKGMILFFMAISIYGVTWTVLSGVQTENTTVTLIMLGVFVILYLFFYKTQYIDERKPSTVEFIGASLYMLTFCLVISRAVSTFDGIFFTKTQSILMTLGIISFFLGDLQLGIYHFIDLKFPMKQAPPFYFIGQLLIGLSCSYF